MEEQQASQLNGSSFSPGETSITQGGILLEKTGGQAYGIETADLCKGIRHLCGSHYK